MKLFYCWCVVILITTVTFSQNVEWQIYTGSNSGLPDEYVLTLAIESNGLNGSGQVMVLRVSTAVTGTFTTQQTLRYHITLLQQLI